jgi:hypothetical protein
MSSASGTHMIVLPGGGYATHVAEDVYVPPEHTYRLARSLAAHGVPQTAHVFAHGPHSLGLAQGSGDAAAWTTLAASWIAEQSQTAVAGGTPRVPPTKLAVGQATLVEAASRSDWAATALSKVAATRRSASSFGVMSPCSRVSDSGCRTPPSASRT